MTKKKHLSTLYFINSKNQRILYSYSGGMHTLNVDFMLAASFFEINFGLLQHSQKPKGLCSTDYQFETSVDNTTSEPRGYLKIMHKLQPIKTEYFLWLWHNYILYILVIVKRNTFTFAVKELSNTFREKLDVTNRSQVAG